MKTIPIMKIVKEYFDPETANYYVGSNYVYLKSEVDKLEIDVNEAKDLIDEILDEARCYDVRTDSPYPGIETKEREKLAQYISNKYMLKKREANDGKT